MSEFDIKSALNRQADILEQKDTIEALRAENARLREALRPFADEAGDYLGLVLGPDIDHWPIDGSRLTLGHLRAARAAMGESDGVC